MYKLTIKDNKKYSQISNDYNPIHLSKKHAQKFFFKSPILHGTNVTKLLLKKYIKKYNFNFTSSIIINFENYININEKFSIITKKKQIIVAGEYNTKIKCNLKFQKQKGIQLSQILDELIFITSYVANKFPGNSSLIHRISFLKNSDNLQKKRLIRRRRLNKYIISIKYSFKGLEVNIIASKLVPFKPNPVIQNLPKKIINKIKDNRILIFGKNSDIANYIKKILPKNINIKYISLRNKNGILFTSSYLKKRIKYLKPNFIFFLASPNIFHGNSKNLYNLYRKIYYFYPKILLQTIIDLKYHCSIFYPSSIAVSDYKLYPYLKSYISAKIKGESLGKNKIFKKYIKFYKLPQLKSRSNYSINGKYEGKNINCIRRYLINFFDN